MSDLALREDGTLVLDMERLGALAFELIGESRECVSLSLMRRIEPPDAAACARLLELCHYRNPAPFPTRAGLAREGELFFAVRMDSYELTLPNVHQALDWLTSLQDQSSTFTRPR
ncbi:type III secretion system chaperone SycN [Prosthecobacter fusiformis]|uniref:Type III secretion system chaperone SycN n=2 Tax=Prosthecobacter fusiformis TaxID=48464 RepID=A0A4R7RY00_9BACT|nr:hypothetical protein [Prosthecobacter fusiformis]TDU70712.1 type III secretion system chaperone SycN [Prosthecobacter fusiformis]